VQDFVLYQKVVNAHRGIFLDANHLPSFGPFANRQIQPCYVELSEASRSQLRQTLSEAEGDKEVG